MDFSFLDDCSTEPDLYAIIGADETSSVEQIKTEFKQKAKKLHPDKVAGTDDKSAHEEFENLRWAYEILSNEDTRGKYDFWRRADLAIPFKAWLKLDDSSRTSMHWALRPKKKLMLPDNQISEETQDKEDMLTASENVSPEGEKSNEAGYSQVHEKLGTVNHKDASKTDQRKTVLKRTLNGFGSSKLSSKFQRYEI